MTAILKGEIYRVTRIRPGVYRYHKMGIGTDYTVTPDSCTCPSFGFSGTCKHVKDVQMQHAIDSSRDAVEHADATIARVMKDCIPGWDRAEFERHMRRQVMEVFP